MPITDITKTVEEQVLGYLTIAQEVVVDGAKRVAEAVDPMLADVPRPFAAEAAELVDDAFSFAEKLLQSGHQLVNRLIDVSDSTTDKPAAAAKPAPSTKAGAK
jgi:hypothetical protein